MIDRMTKEELSGEIGVEAPIAATPAPGTDIDCAAFFDPSLSLDERPGAIAAELRKGKPSERFCRLLAGMIDGEKNFTRFALVLRMQGRGQPTTVTNVDLGKAMIAATAGVKRTHLRRKKHEVAKKFGVNSAKAEAAMKAERRDDEARQFRERIERQGLQLPEGKEFDE